MLDDGSGNFQIGFWDCKTKNALDSMPGEF